MKRIFGALLLIIAIVSLIALFFTYNQVNGEQTRLQNDIQYRSTLLAESLRESVEPNFINKSNSYLQNVVERYDNKERIAGLAVLDNKGNMVAVSATLPKELTDAEQVAVDVMDSDKANGDFITVNGNKLYVFAIPLHDQQSVVGSLLIIQNAGYIDTRLMDIWRTNFVRLITQALIIAIAIALVLRWIIYQPMKLLVDSIKKSRLDNSGRTTKIPNNPIFAPLVNEISQFQRSLMEARSVASEEAKLRSEKVESPWTAERLKEFIKDLVKERTIYVVSNREPYIHTRTNGKISYYFPASGMATAIEPIMRACEGTWVAHGSGDADHETVDKFDHIKVPPDEPRYTLRRVWLTPKEEQGYYYGFSNEGLWPLCHLAHTRPIFRKEDWAEYKKVNAKFAQALLAEIKNQEKPIILIQDYHFALLPRMIKRSRPDALIGLFWHVPWPNSESFSICPFRKELLDGMLGADLLGFHTQLHCNNFIDTVSREVESLIDWERFAVERDNHLTFIKPFPISIAFYNGHKVNPQDATTKKKREEILKELNIHTKYIGLGVDRLDYTKGILERFKAIEAFLETYPDYKKNFTFIQIAPGSRGEIEKYKEFAADVKAEAERINKKFKEGSWTPIVLLNKRYSHEELDSFYKLAQVCLVTSLHDGMNLVAKEFIAARDDEKGVLVLSQFTGASRELKESLIVNPYNTQQVAEAINEGLTMAPLEQTRRMKKMRDVIRNYNVYRWSAELLKTMVGLES